MGRQWCLFLKQLRRRRPTQILRYERDILRAEVESVAVGCGTRHACCAEVLAYEVQHANCAQPVLCDGFLSPGVPFNKFARIGRRGGAGGD